MELEKNTFKLFFRKRHKNVLTFVRAALTVLHVIQSEKKRSKKG